MIVPVNVQEPFRSGPFRSVEVLRSFQPGDFDQGEQVVTARTGIGRLARGMNLMLDRLQSFNERQRRFVADASHELSSPLASTLADLEEALAHPQSTDWPEIARVW